MQVSTSLEKIADEIAKRILYEPIRNAVSDKTISIHYGTR